MSRRFGLSAAVLFAAVIIAPRVPRAATGPAISAVAGALAQGNTITISGSGFGTKSVAAPVKYDDFETGTIGQKIGNGWALDSYNATYDPIYSNTVLRPNSTRSAQSRFFSGNTSSNFGLENITPIAPVYMDFWVYLDFGGSYPGNFKLFRIYGGPLGSVPEAYLGYSGGWIMESETGYYPNTSLPVWSAWFGSGVKMLSDWDRKWMHVQTYFKMSDARTGTNGYMNIWVNGVQQFSEQTAVNWLWRDTGQPATWDILLFGNYGYATPTGYSSYWDNVYVDNTRAHVEIGDSAVYGSATHREIQVPRTWSDSSVSVALNKGSFSSFAGLYAYVVDANGTASAGFPLSSVVTSGAPGSPTGLRVVR